MNANKFWIALGGAVALLGSALKDGHLSISEAVDVATVFLAALGVYQVSNQPKAPKA